MGTAGQRLWGRGSEAEICEFSPHVSATQNGRHPQKFLLFPTVTYHLFILPCPWYAVPFPSQFLYVIPRVIRAHCISLTGIINFVVFRLWNTKTILAPFHDLPCLKGITGSYMFEKSFCFSWPPSPNE